MTTAGGKFGPGESVTRIEFVRLLHRALGISIEYFAAPDITGSFDDMKKYGRRSRFAHRLRHGRHRRRRRQLPPGDTLAREVMIRWLVRRSTT